MEIKKITFKMGNDFYADMVCEHCGHEGELKTGYHDGFFHNNVIPSMLCGGCGKNRAGGTEPTDKAVGVMTI